MTVIRPNLFFKRLINSKFSSIFKPLSHSRFSFLGHEVGGRPRGSAWQPGHLPRGQRLAPTARPQRGSGDTAAMCPPRHRVGAGVGQELVPRVTQPPGRG